MFKIVLSDTARVMDFDWSIVPNIHNYVTVSRDTTVKSWITPPSALDGEWKSEPTTPPYGAIWTGHLLGYVKGRRTCTNYEEMIYTRPEVVPPVTVSVEAEPPVTAPLSENATFRILLVGAVTPVDFDWSMVPDRYNYVSVDLNRSVFAYIDEPWLVVGADGWRAITDGPVIEYLGLWSGDKPAEKSCQGWVKMLFKRPADSVAADVKQTTHGAPVDVKRVTHDEVDKLVTMDALDSILALALSTVPGYGPSKDVYSAESVLRYTLMKRGLSPDVIKSLTVNFGPLVTQLNLLNCQLTYER
jgi:hypothetical protein